MDRGYKIQRIMALAKGKSIISPLSPVYEWISGNFDSDELLNYLEGKGDMPSGFKKVREEPFIPGFALFLTPLSEKDKEEIKEMYHE